MNNLLKLSLIGFLACVATTQVQAAEGKKPFGGRQLPTLTGTPVLRKTTTRDQATNAAITSADLVTTAPTPEDAGRRWGTTLRKTRTSEAASADTGASAADAEKVKPAIPPKPAIARKPADRKKRTDLVEQQPVITPSEITLNTAAQIAEAAVLPVTEEASVSASTNRLTPEEYLTILKSVIIALIHKNNTLVKAGFKSLNKSLLANYFTDATPEHTEIHKNEAEFFKILEQLYDENITPTDSQKLFNAFDTFSNKVNAAMLAKSSSGSTPAITTAVVAVADQSNPFVVAAQPQSSNDDLNTFSNKENTAMLVIKNSSESASTVTDTVVASADQRFAEQPQSSNDGILNRIGEWLAAKIYKLTPDTPSSTASK